MTKRLVAINAAKESMRNSRNKRLAGLTYDTQRGYVRFSAMSVEHHARVQAMLCSLIESGVIRLVKCALTSDSKTVAGAYYVNPPSVEIENQIRDVLGVYCCG